MRSAVDRAITEGAAALFAVQRPDGVFAFDREWASVLGTAAAVTSLHFADPDGSAELITRGVAWLCRVQRPNGGWGTVAGSDTEPLATAVATAVLGLLAPGHPAVGKGQVCLENLGGVEAIPDDTMIRVCRQYQSLAGWFDESTLPRLPLELVLFPKLCRRLLSFRAPLFAAAAAAQARRRGHRLLSRLAEPKALALIRQVYEHEGRTGEFSGDAWAAGQLCIALARSGIAPDLVAAVVARLRSTVRPDGSWDMMPLDLTWSSFAASGLVAAGYGDDPRMAATFAMFRARQQDSPFAAFGCPPGSWGFSGARGWPMALETAEVVSVLARSPADPAVAAGIAWLTSQQDRQGSWSLCVRDTKVAALGPCVYLTCQAVQALLDSGVPVSDRRVRRAVRWLLSQQHSDGSFDGMWYRDRTSNTAFALETLTRLGSADAAGRARDFLVRTQEPDGSWGTVEETAWALHALVSGPEAERGVTWLLSCQRADGSWPEAPVSEFIRACSRYPNGGLTMGLTLRALARYREAA